MAAVTVPPKFQVVIPKEVRELCEVFRRILQQRDEGPALQAVAAMQQGHVADLDASLALTAARLSTERKLPMADSVILATAQAFGAVLWTQGADFKGMTGVRYRRHKSRKGRE